MSILIVTSCFQNIQDVEFEGNVFDKNYEGDIIKNLHFTSEIDPLNDCYLDVYFTLPKNVIESFVSINNEDGLTGGIAVYLDGNYRYGVVSTAPKWVLEREKRIDQVKFFAPGIKRKLEFYLEHEIFDSSEKQKVLFHTFELECMD